MDKEKIMRKREKHESGERKRPQKSMKNEEWSDKRQRETGRGRDNRRQRKTGREKGKQAVAGKAARDKTRSEQVRGDKRGRGDRKRKGKVGGGTK